MLLLIFIFLLLPISLQTNDSLCIGHFPSKIEWNKTNNTSIYSELSDKKDILFYPNPINQHLNLKINKEFHGNLIITLIDIRGKKIKTITEKSDFYAPAIIQIDIEELNLSSGTYFLNIKLNDEIYTKKLIVNK